MPISSTHFAIVNGTVILPDTLIEDGMVVWSKNQITQVSKRKRVPKGSMIIDAQGGLIAPGFIDIHVHGGAGSDFMDATVADVLTVCRSHLNHGTTTIFPTTTTGTHQNLLQMIESCRLAKSEITRNPELGAAIAGIHLYGPFFAEDKTGCHDRSECRTPETDDFAAYFATKMIRVATCAAELPGAADFYRVARRRRCLVTCGHSNSSWTEMQAAFNAGMRHVDHFWCAMSSVPSLRQRFGTPMQASMAEFVLMNPDMSTEVIADGCHLAPELLEFAFRMKGPARLCLVTDCNRALDMPPGDYIFGNRTTGTMFRSDGQVGWAGTGSLASAVMGMDHMVRHMKQTTSADLPATFRMASLTPAERTGIDGITGSLTPGKQADILILDQGLNIREVFAKGLSVVHH
ncbi:MAG: amidohydrolase family protein [Planctomycetia bacterium]